MAMFVIPPLPAALFPMPAFAINQLLCVALLYTLNFSSISWQG